MAFGNLPPAFDDFTILHLSDLHADISEGAMRRLASIVGALEYDICVLTGDYRGKTYGPFENALQSLSNICFAEGTTLRGAAATTSFSMDAGMWRSAGMAGYTSAGAGTSLMLDENRKWDPLKAVEIARIESGMDFYWREEPEAGDDQTGALPIDAAPVRPLGARGEGEHSL